jgi:hypothetical protein
MNTSIKLLIKVIGRSQPSEILNPQNDVESVNFSARACWKAQKSELNTLPSGLKKSDRMSKTVPFTQINIGFEHGEIALHKWLLSREGDF